jgi:hypothetical protein
VFARCRSCCCGLWFPSRRVADLPRFDEDAFGALSGAVGGGVGGSLIGVGGALAGWLAPQGKARGLIFGLWAVFLVLGVASLGFGLYALTAGQPYGIWYGPTLAGGLATFLMAMFFPLIRLRYAQADARKMEAEDIRRA